MVIDSMSEYSVRQCSTFQSQDQDQDHAGSGSGDVHVYVRFKLHCWQKQYDSCMYTHNSKL